MVPERLGAFEITGLLGEGGSALVYAARDGVREIALKVLHPDLYLDEKQVERFLDEAERMRRVRHPALVEVLRAGTLPGGRPFIVMPLLRGRSLAARLHEGALPLPFALQMWSGLAEAVATLHSAGLVHRDIKPENVFWCEPEDRLLLLDLGIARESQAGPSTTTRAGLMRGTPAYMAPERLFGQSATIRTDVYELGLLFFMMLTAKLPWDEGDPAGRMKPALRDADRTLVPDAIADVLFDVLSIDVAKRPESVEELAARLRMALPRALSAPPSALHAHTASGNYAYGMSAAPEPPAELAPHRASPPAALGSNLTPLAAVVPYSSAGLNPPARRSPVLVAALALGAAGALGIAFAYPALRGPQAAATGSVLQASEPAEASSGSDVLPAPAASVLALPGASASGSAAVVAEASASASASASGSARAPVKEGTLPRSAVEPRIMARMGAMQSCFQSEAERSDFTGGRVVLNFWIGLDGAVSSISTKTTDVPPPVAQCVTAQVRTIRFPAPVGGPVNVIFPVRFEVKRTKPAAP